MKCLVASFAAFTICSSALMLDKNNTQATVPLVWETHHPSTALSGYVRARQFDHRLRVCNAYPNEASLIVSRRQEAITEPALNYRECQDVKAPLTSGDRLEFKVGGVSAGIFAVSDLPNNDAVLLLVIHRHDTLTTAASFSSHVFANLLNSQVAVLDTYQGRSTLSPNIVDEIHGKARRERLRFNSVVAVNEGEYQVNLVNTTGGPQLSRELVALNRESYVVIRTGVASQSGPSFPEDLIVFPQSSVALLSGAKLAGPTSAVLLLAVLAWFI
jgi:hypothetical protein